MPATSSRTPDRLDLIEFLGELRQEPRPILFIANPGNAGDSLIAHATRQLFDRLGLDYVWVNSYRRLDPRGRVVVYGGGGNLVPLYDDASRALRWADGRAKRLLVLPHTVDGHEQLLADLGPETDLICRELVSYEYVSSVLRSARCHLADDLALATDTEATLAIAPEPMPALPLYGRKLLYRAMLKPSWSKSVAAPWKLRRSERLFQARRAELARGGASRVLHVLRTDFEQTRTPTPPDNLDLSDLFNFGTEDANSCHTGAHHLLRYLDLFEEVRTNRLHVAIGAALLGKQVKFQYNSYFKNRAVYEFSIRDRFPNLEWIEAA